MSSRFSINHQAAVVLFLSMLNTDDKKGLILAMLMLIAENPGIPLFQEVPRFLSKIEIENNSMLL